MSDTTITCPQRYDVTPTEVNGIAVDFRGVLREGEVCTGTPTVTATGMTATSPTVSTSSQVINTQNVEAGKAVNFTLTGGTDQTDYNIKVSCGTSQSRTREVYVFVRVRIPTAAIP